MRFEAEVAGRRIEVTVRKSGDGYELTLGDRHLFVDARAAGTGAWSLLFEGRSYEAAVQGTGALYLVRLRGTDVAVQLSEAGPGGVVRAPDARGAGRLLAPMPGKVVRVLAAAGDEVAAGAGLVVVEAMKMENELRAGRAGRIRAVHVREGQPVEGGALLVEIE